MHRTQAHKPPALLLPTALLDGKYDRGGKGIAPNHGR